MSIHDFFKLVPVDSDVFPENFDSGFSLSEEMEIKSFKLHDLDWDDTAVFFAWDPSSFKIVETSLQVFKDRLTNNHWIDSISVLSLL